MLPGSLTIGGSLDEWIATFDALRANTVCGPLDISLIDAGPDHLTLRMPITDATRQPFGLLHGGISMVLAETAASTHAAHGVDLSERYPVGLEINGSHLRSASEGVVLAKARVLRRSRAAIVHEVEIVHEGTDRLLCVARVTSIYKRTGEGA